MPGEACRVALELFEGPLDLLLYLIKREELDIREISLAQVAEQYLAYVRQAEELDLDLASEYLVMAATLTGIKSRALLPGRETGAEGEEDSAEALLRQLVLYKAFREVAEELRDSESIWRNAFPTPGERERWATGEIVVPVPGQLTIVDLLEAIEAVTSPEEEQAPTKLERPRLTIAQCISVIAELLPPGRRVSLRVLAGPGMTRARLIGFFVALLELVRRGWVDFRQTVPFGEITFRRTGRWVEGCSTDSQET
jgi:segregation and condensation protein A